MASQKITLNTDGGSSPVSLKHEKTYTFRRGSSVQCVVTGTANYSVQWSNDGGSTWTNHASLASATATAGGSFEQPVEKVRLLQNSGTGSVACNIFGMND